MARRTIDLDAPLNLGLVLGPLVRGRGGPPVAPPRRRRGRGVGPRRGPRPRRAAVAPWPRRRCDRLRAASSSGRRRPRPAARGAPSRPGPRGPPGPRPGGPRAARGPAAPAQRLRLQPSPEALAALPYFAFHPLGVEQRRADIVRRVARDAGRLEALAELPGSRPGGGGAGAGGGRG